MIAGLAPNPTGTRCGTGTNDKAHCRQLNSHTSYSVKTYPGEVALHTCRSLQNYSMIEDVALPDHKLLT